MSALRGATSPKGISPEGVSNDATIGFDADGRILSASASAAAVLGYARPQEMEGLALSALIGENAAGGMLLQTRSAGEPERTQAATEESVRQLGAVTFVRKDGSRVSVNPVVTPETSGGWITLLDVAATGKPVTANPPGPPDRPSDLTDIAATLRNLADQTVSTGGEREICARFAEALRLAARTDAVTVARSTGTAGLYESVAHSVDPHGPVPEPISDAVDLPPALIPQRGAGPISVDSLEGLALFDPVIIGGEEASGAYLAARAEYLDGSHVLVIANAPAAAPWPDETSLLLETGVLTLSGTLRTAELGSRLASSARAHEAVRQIGVLASQDLDGGFLEAARRVIARRLPVSAISIHVIDAETSRCYVAASTGGDSEGLVPGFAWPLAGSIEQRVLKSGAPLFISASSPERVSAPPSTVAHWRAAGLQTVVAVPLREAGEVIAVLVAGFSSALSGPTEVVRLLESITPAVHLGVGLSSGRPGAAPEPDDSAADPGFVPPRLLLAITRAAAESPDTATLFASVTEWLQEIIPSGRVAWGTIDHATRTYRRLYNYDTASTAHAGQATAHIAESEYESLGAAGLQLPEPGHAPDGGRSIRVAVTAGERVLGIVTAWAREDEQFSQVDMARLQRVCEFISGPLDRILEIEAAREAKGLRDLIDEIGFQAAGFYEPAPALRTVRPLVNRLFPHDRAIFIDIDSVAGIAVVRYDSAASPNDTTAHDFLLTSLPSPEIAESDIPLNISIEDLASSPSAQIGPVFIDFASLLAIPVSGGADSFSALLLLNSEPDAFADSHIERAAALSAQLAGAQAGWQAHRSSRESTREVREIRKQLNLLLDSAPVALISTDANGVCTRLEGHGLETLDVKREDMLGKSIFELTGRLPQLEDAIRQALRGVPASAITTLGNHSAEVWAQPVTETDGSVKGVTLIGYDISDRIRSKRAVAENRELQRTIKDFTRFVTTVSHELRNPLQSIIAFTEILAMGGAKQLTQQQAHAVSIIEKSSDQLNELIGDLLSMDTGSYELELSPVSVRDLMREIIDSKLPIFSLANQTLTLSLPRVECTVNADRLRLTQVVTNLLSNASKHSQEGAEVCLDIAVSGPNLKISVIDNGPGIPADQLERVWDPGIRLPGADNRSVPGKGLGLPIVRNIVERGGSGKLNSGDKWILCSNRA